MHPAIFLGLTLAAGCAIVLWQRSRAGELEDPAGVADVPSSSSADPGQDAHPIASIATSSDPVSAASQFLFAGSSSSSAQESASMNQIPTAAAISSLYTPPASAAPFLDYIRSVEVKYSLPENLLVRQLQKESNFNPRAVNPRSGAQGIAQFMTPTAKDLGVDPFDPLSAIDGAGRYMRMLFNSLGSWTAALAGYNWGWGNVQRRGVAAAPPETQDYIAFITSKVDVGS